MERPAPEAAIPPPVAAPTPQAFVPPPVISKFGAWNGAGGGPRLWQHSGVDIRAAVGTPVLAAADGTVVRVGRQFLAGKLIVLRHAEHLATVYFHLSEIAVTSGQAVRRGEMIGRVGNTGNATTPHLHFGVCRRDGGQCGDRIDAGWADPAAYWVTGNPCFVAARIATVEPGRLSYPVACTPRVAARARIGSARS